MLFLFLTFIAIIQVLCVLIIINKIPHTAERHFPIKGLLFIFIFAITFISHIICTHAHDAEADHIIDSEPNWRCRGDAAG